MIDTGPLGAFAGAHTKPLACVAPVFPEKSRPGCVDCDGAERLSAIITVVPRVVTVKSFAAKSTGSRTHPAEAGYPGKCPSRARASEGPARSGNCRTAKSRAGRATSDGTFEQENLQPKGIRQCGTRS